MVRPESLQCVCVCVESSSQFTAGLTGDRQGMSFE